MFVSKRAAAGVGRLCACSRSLPSNSRVKQFCWVKLQWYTSPNEGWTVFISGTHVLNVGLTAWRKRTGGWMLLQEAS